MKKKIMAIILCFTMVFTMTGYVGLGDYTFAYAEDMGQELQEFTEQESIDQEVVEVEKTIYQQLIIADSIEGMYALVLDFMNNEPEGLKALTAEEIVALKSHVNMLDPESIEVDTQDLLDSLSILPNGGEELKETPELLADATWTGTINAQTLNTTQTISLTSGSHWLTGTITISGNAHVTIVGEPGSEIRRGGELTGPMFNIHNGSTLTIIGASDESRVTLYGEANQNMNGNDHATQDQTMIRCDGDLNLKYVNMYGNKTAISRDYEETATDATKDNFAGGAITVCDNKGNDITIENCRIYDNTATRGAGIYLCRTGGGTLTVKNTVFDNCDATISGGAIFFDGRPSNGQTVPAGSGTYGTGHLNYEVTLDNVTIQNCDSLEGCGSAIYMHDRGSANITMKDCTVQKCKSFAASCGTVRCDGNSSYKLTVENCLIQNNESKAGHGSGIYWNALGPKAALVVNNSRILNNTASHQGGGMFVEGSSIEVTNTLIKGNKASMGGGIGIKTFADTGFREGASGRSFNMELGTGVVIEENIATSKGGGISYNIVSGVPESGFVFNYTNSGAIIRNNVVNSAGDINGTPTGVGGGIAIINDITNGEATFPDRTYSANTVINSGTISGNKAKDGGAAHITVGDFKMNGGTIADHTVAGNGGGVYLTGGNVEIAGGEIKNSGATNGAAVYMTNGTFKMTGGKLLDNTASENGGAVYISNGDFTMTSGAISNNEAALDGGAVYVNGGEVTVGLSTCDGTGTHSHPILQSNDAKNGGAIAVTTGVPIMYCGNFFGNTADENGGAIYVANGGFTMHGGTIDGGTLPVGAVNAKLGGAVYVSGGNFTMSSGSIQNNIATNNGGAVFANSGNFVMTSGVIKENRTTANDSNGGGVYVKGGSITIGVKDCNGKDINHSVAPTDKPHPIITKNQAMDSGGGIALIGSGDITLHCGDVIDNKAVNRGRGLNIYMESGTFTFNAGNVGNLGNPELVIVGGELVDTNKEPDNDENKVTLEYHHCNVKDQIHGALDEAVKIAHATKGVYFNLPDGEKYWTAEKGYRFFGWTFYGPDTEAAKENVRDKKDYKPLGEPILVDGNIDGGNDNTIHMYALWAPETSDITYKGVVIDGVYESESLNMTGNPDEYHFNVGSNVITLNAPVKDGYTFTGWYIYQDENQNANWGDNYEPVYAEGEEHTYANLDFAAMSDQFLAVGKDGKYSLEAGFTNFGDITLVAAFEPAFTDLKITKNGWDPKDENQTFVFEVKGTPFNKELPRVDMTVTIAGNGEVIIKDLPVGVYYVREVTEWSWRYQVDGNNPKEVTIDDPTETKVVEFKNKRDNNFWLSSDSSCENWWGGTDNTIIKNPIFKEEGGNVNV